MMQCVGGHTSLGQQQQQTRSIKHHSNLEEGRLRRTDGAHAAARQDLGEQPIVEQRLDHALHIYKNECAEQMGGSDTASSWNMMLAACDGHMGWRNGS